MREIKPSVFSEKNCIKPSLIFLSGVILATSFTIQWILYSIQFSLVSAEYCCLVISCSYRKVWEW